MDVSRLFISPLLQLKRRVAKLFGVVNYELRRVFEESENKESEGFVF